MGLNRFEEFKARLSSHRTSWNVQRHIEAERSVQTHYISLRKESFLLEAGAMIEGTTTALQRFINKKEIEFSAYRAHV